MQTAQNVDKFSTLDITDTGDDHVQYFNNRN